MPQANNTVTVDVRSQIPSSAQAVVVFASDAGKLSGDTSAVGSGQLKAAERVLAAGVVRGKAREIGFDLIECGKNDYRRVYVAGLGAKEKLNAETVRQSAGAVARALRKHRIENVALVPPALSGKGISGAEAAVTGFLLAAFDDQAHKGMGSKKPGNDCKPLRMKITVLGGAGLKHAANRAVAVAESQNFARTIANRPGNDINPPKLAQVAQELCRKNGLTCRVLDEKQMKKLGMGGILAVGAGSNATPPRLIVMEYKPRGGKKSQRPLLVVGKAITFDSGGISIKPSEKMGKMVYDKCGAMAVLGLMAAVGRLKPSVPVIGILSSAENLLSETSYRPGDILHMYNGVTVEVTNTDAEGRLVLGDALAWGIETFKPAAVIDLATLTGGCVVALGLTQAGLMSNSDALTAEIQKAADIAGEKVWRLPVGDDQREQLKSDLADIVNSAGRWGSPITAGAFLSYFIPRDDSVPWVHLDIAGVADTEKELPYYGKGATGWGVRTLVEWVTARSTR
jgi:leucyl aminopeptidase